MQKGTCSVESCSHPQHTRGYCGMHYHRVLRYGEPGTPFAVRATPGRIKRPAIICMVEGCERETKWHGYCHTHKVQINTVGYTRPIAPKHPTRRPCVMPGCERVATSSRMCDTHAGRANKHGLSSVQLMWIEQITTCDMCGIRDQEKLHIDHDHTCCDRSDRQPMGCGRCIRGLLCMNCNLALGYVRDDPRVLRAGLAYLGAA